MKNVKVIPVMAALVVEFLLSAAGSITQNSFSQSLDTSRRRFVTVVEQDSEIRFKADTMFLNRQLAERLDSLYMENQKTKEIIEEKKPTIKLQRVNRRKLIEIKELISRANTLEEWEMKEYMMPKIVILYPRQQPEPLPVNIEIPSSERVKIPVVRKSLFQKIFKRK